MDVNSFFNIKANSTILGHFFWQQFGLKCHCPRDLTFPWEPCFDKHVFSKLQFPYFKIKQRLSCSIFKVLRSFYVFLLVLVTFDPILDDFVEALDKSKMADQHGRHSVLITQLLRHIASSPHIADVEGDIFRRTIYPPSLVVITFIFLEFVRGLCFMQRYFD